MNKKGVILLSGGLDSLVSLDIAIKKVNIELALIFNYGQKAYLDELNAAKKICKHYSIKLKKIELPFLKEISNNSLTNKNKNNLEALENIWIPNRNGLFLNIAACYCDKLKYDFVIFGANKQEARIFPDNTKKFIEVGIKFFKYSTINNIKILAPCLELDKKAIINYAIDNNVPIKHIKSCYNGTQNAKKKHCGKCLSCKLLHDAILKSKKPELIEEIF